MKPACGSCKPMSGSILKHASAPLDNLESHANTFRTDSHKQPRALMSAVFWSVCQDFRPSPDGVMGPGLSCRLGTPQSPLLELGISARPGEGGGMKEETRRPVNCPQGTACDL